MIGSWYYTSELPAEEAATLRAAMVSKDCESLETWLKTSVHDADRKARLYALLRHAAFESWLAGLELLIKYDADVNPPAGGGRRDGALELIKLRKLCAGDTPRAHWIGGERLLKNLFAAELPEELFRKVITFWAPVWR